MPKRPEIYQYESRFHFTVDTTSSLTQKESGDKVPFTREESREHFYYQFNPSKGFENRKEQVKALIGEECMVTDDEIREERSNLHEAAKELLINHLLEKKHYPHPVPGRPFNAFTMYEDTEEARKFNEKLVELNKNGTLEEQVIFYWEQMQREFNESGLKFPEDYDRIYEMSDREIVENYEKYDRLLSMAFEDGMINGDLERVAGKEEYEKYNAIRVKLQDVKSVLDGRMNLILNPHYPDVDVSSFQTLPAEKRMDIADEIKDLPKEESDRIADPLDLYISHANILAMTMAVGTSAYIKDKYKNFDEITIVNEFGQKNEEAFGDKLMERVGNSKPFFYRTPDDEVKIIQLEGRVKEISATEFLKGLDGQLKKADTYRHTGSKEFSNMSKSFQKMMDLFEEPGKNSDPEKMDELLQEIQKVKSAAEKYLTYKGIDINSISQLTGSLTVDGRGKHEREQNRLEAALSILEFTRGYSVAYKDALDRVWERSTEAYKEKEEENRAKEREENFKPLKEAEMNLRTEAMDRELSSTMAVSFEDALPFGLSQRDTGMLTMMALGENYNSVVPDLMNNSKFTDAQRNAVTDAKSKVAEALTEARDGNFEKLGSIIAEGINRNNRFLNKQNQINMNYCILADLGADALKFSHKNHELKAAVENQLKKINSKVSHAAQAAYNISHVWKEGQKVMEDIQQAGPNAEALKDPTAIAKINQMYAINMQMSHKLITSLGKSYYQSSDVVKSINTTMAESSRMKSFMNLSGEKKMEMIQNHKVMTDFYQEALQEKITERKENVPATAMDKKVSKSQINLN